MFRRLNLTAVACASLAGACTHSPTPAPAQPGPAASLAAIADDYYAWALDRQPEAAYFSGIDIDRHDGLFDNSLAAQRQREHEIDALLARLRTIDADRLEDSADWITYAYLEHELASTVATRVCRKELWNVNQLSGWQLAYPQLAQLQPMGTAELRAQALARWQKFPAFVEHEIDNLRTGLALGYSAPQSVVRRVIEQLDGLLALEVEQSPFYSMAQRDGDEQFATDLGRLVAGRIVPALENYRDFLLEEYLPQARATLSVTDIPDGRACYEAALRAYTTIDRSGADVYALGQRTVAENRARVIELGRAAYGVDDFVAVIEAAKSDPHERFESADELLEFSRAAVARAEQAMPRWVATMPAQPVEVVPFEEHEEGTGRSAHYRPGNDERPGEYRIPLFEPQNQLPGNAEATAFHETWPGHHLQVASAQAVAGLHPVTRIIWFSGPGEGWARYSEALAEEMGLYQTRTGPILRRAWPARGMVVDPGLHLFGWTREQAVSFMSESGRFPARRAEEMVDRIAIWPGQLTAYDSGALEIVALRRAAERALGQRFDIREFHDAVLAVGTVPLPALRSHIERWIDKRR